MLIGANLTPFNIDIANAYLKAPASSAQQNSAAVGSWSGWEFAGYNYENSSHSDIKERCVTCHMAASPSYLAASASNFSKADTMMTKLGRHTFKVAYEHISGADTTTILNPTGCEECHGEASIEFVELTQAKTGHALRLRGLSHLRGGWMSLTRGAACPGRVPVSCASACRPSGLSAIMDLADHRSTIARPRGGSSVSVTRSEVAAAIQRAQADLEQALADLDKLPAVDVRSLGLAALALSNFLTVSGAVVDGLMLSLRDHPEPQVRIWLEGLRHATNLMVHTVSQLMKSSAAVEPSLRFEAVDLAWLVQSACAYYRRATEGMQLENLQPDQHLALSSMIDKTIEAGEGVHREIQAALRSLVTSLPVEAKSVPVGF